MHTPLKFPDSPEGKRLLRAGEEYRRVQQQIDQLIKEDRAKRKGPGPYVYKAYENESFVKARDECRSADKAYYMATGDDSHLGYSPIPRGRWEPFQKSVEKYFGKIVSDLNSKLVKILPWTYGFATTHAVVILDVMAIDHGTVAFSVTLQPCKQDEKIEFSDEGKYRGIGLGHIVRFQNPDDLKNCRSLNCEDLSDQSLKDHAELLWEYGKNFLVDPNANWTGLQEHVRLELEKIREGKTWLKNPIGKSVPAQIDLML